MTDNGSDNGKQRRMSGGKPSAPKRGRKTKKMDKSNATRMMTHKVKTARGRKMSSKLWIERQINDPYVKEAAIKGYRSRAAFKLIELDDKFDLIKPGYRIVDLGCAPGGWLQIAQKRGASEIVGIDLLEVEAVPDVDILEMDFMHDDAPEKIKELLGGDPDLVMSDLAANTTGHRNTDHLKTIALVEAAAEFAMETLRPGGNFVAKVFQGGTEGELLARLKASFKSVRHAKPKSSRAGSPEIYLVALGFKRRKRKEEARDK